jgi:hypothetical protein
MSNMPWTFIYGMLEVYIYIPTACTEGINIYQYINSAGKWVA